MMRAECSQADWLPPPELNVSAVLRSDRVLSMSLLFLELWGVGV